MLCCSQGATTVLPLLAPITAIEYLEAALPFAHDHGVSMAIAQLDLTKPAAGYIDLSENYRCSLGNTSRCSPRRWITSSPDLNGRLDRLEVRFEHSLVNLSRSVSVRFRKFNETSVEMWRTRIDLNSNP